MSKLHLNKNGFLHQINEIVTTVPHNTSSWTSQTNFLMTAISNPNRTVARNNPPMTTVHTLPTGLPKGQALCDGLRCLRRLKLMVAAWVCVLHLAVNNTQETYYRDRTLLATAGTLHKSGDVWFGLERWVRFCPPDREDYVNSSMDEEFSKNWALEKQSSFRTKSHIGLAEQMSLGTDLETKAMIQSL